MTVLTIPDWVKQMHINTIKTHKIEASDSLQKILDQYLINIDNNDIVVISSKIISIIQNRLIAKNTINKRDLIYQESDLILETDSNNPPDFYLTIKNNLLIPSAGIDESNVNNSYVLYPENIEKTTLWIWEYLKIKNKLNNLGIIIADSHVTIMRRGVTGIALAWCGFEPLYSYIDKPDIYNHSLKYTQINILDALAVSAVFMMGEGNEQTPFAVIKNAPKISFLDRPPSIEERKSIIISMEEDLYAPLLRAGKWVKA
jgi:putative folate metabolism gamma-glutamate ligase